MEFVMKILFLEWKSYCVPDMAEAFIEAGHDVTLATCAEMTDRYNTEFDIFFGITIWWIMTAPRR